MSTWWLFMQSQIGFTWT